MSAVVDWKRVEWVMLDMDGTLLDLAFDNHFWLRVLPEAYARQRSISFDEARRMLEPAFTAQRGHLNWYCLDWWAQHTGLDVLALKRQTAERIRSLPQAGGFLNAVRQSGKRLWLATNAHQHSLQLKMECTGLAHQFDRLICSHDIGAPKEQRAFWVELQARLPFDPARTLFVDDSLSVVKAAVDYGIGQVVVISKPDSTLPVREVRGFKAVESVGDLLPVLA